MIFKYLIFFFPFNAVLLSQTQLKDSLFNLLRTADDTSKYKVYLKLGEYYENKNKDSTLFFYNSAESISEKIPGLDGKLKKASVINKIGNFYVTIYNYDNALKMFNQSLEILKSNSGIKNVVDFRKKYLLLAKILGSIGLVYFSQSNYLLALKYYQISLGINKDIGYKIGEAYDLGRIANLYYNQDKIRDALDYYFQAIKIFESEGNKRGQALNLGNVGLIYLDLKNYDKALEFFFKSLKLNREIGNNKSIAFNYANIALAFDLKGNQNTALDYYFKALKLNSEFGNLYNQASNLGNIATIYFSQGNLNKSLEYNLSALSINQKIDSKIGIAINYSNIGEVYLIQKKYAETEKYLVKAEQFYLKLNTKAYLNENNLLLSNFYSQIQNHKKAFEYYKKYIVLKDTLLSEENLRFSLIKDMKYQYEKEQALKEKEHQKQLAVEKEKQEKQNLVTRFIIAGLILVVLFSGFIVNRLKVTSKHKRIIEKQKRLVEEQKKIVEEQKLIVEQKNKDITDSIKYSKRIQDAILPNLAKWKMHLPDSFIFYLPKDIVAGDFYWLEYRDNNIYVSAADCTGHGVSGAMVSVVCSNALSKAVLEEKIIETDEILNRVREIVIEKLTSDENIRDGMDICLIRLSKDKKSLQYSGANRPLYVVYLVTKSVPDKSFQAGNEVKDNGYDLDSLHHSTIAELTEFKPDKQPIGRYEEMKPFSKQEIILQKSTMLYLTTDGYADQLGGLKGKKIGSKRLKELLIENAKIHEPDHQH